MDWRARVYVNPFILRVLLWVALRLRVDKGLERRVRSLLLVLRGPRFVSASLRTRSQNKRLYDHGYDSWLGVGVAQIATSTISTGDNIG